MDEQETKEKERLEMLGLANCYILKRNLCLTHSTLLKLLTAGDGSLP